MRIPSRVDRTLCVPWLAALILVTTTGAPASPAHAASHPGAFAPVSSQASDRDGDALAEGEDGVAQDEEDESPTVRPSPKAGLDRPAPRRITNPTVPGAPLMPPRRQAAPGRLAQGAGGDAAGDGEKTGDPAADEEGAPAARPAPKASGAAQPKGSADSEEWSTEESRKRQWEAKPPPSKLPVRIDFVDADLKDVVKYFSELTGRNFILAENLSGKITIMSPSPVTSGEAYEAFLAALDAAGFTTVVEGRFTRIVKSADAAKEPIRFYKGEFVPETANFVTRLIRVENVNAGDVSQVINGMIGPGASLTVYSPTNTLILTDSANNIRRLQELISELDVSAPKAKLEIVKIQFAEATEILEKVNAIFGTDGEASTASRGRATAPQTPAERSRARRSREPEPAASTSETIGGEERYISKMIADERTNSIVILATEKAIEDVKGLIAQLDYEVDPWAKSDIHVVYLQHAKAEDLAQVLANLAQSSSTAAGAQTGNRRTQPAATGRNAAAAGRNARTPAAAAAATPEAAAGGISATFESGVKITADASTNALVITASRDDFRALKSVIEKLDIRRKQVFVETVIMEVNDSSRLDAGNSFHMGAPAGDAGAAIGAFGATSLGILSALSDPTQLGAVLTGAAIGLIGKSIDTGLVDASGNAIQIPAFGVVLTALQVDGTTNVLSAPNLMTLANEEAEFVVGETVPFSTGGTLTQTGLPSFNVTREDVALTLRLTPQINEGDEVRLEVYQEISRLGETINVGNGLQVPKTTKRSAKTVISASDNQTIVLSGLMETNDTVSESKVPVLGDIPLIGALFRTKTKTKQKTNLLIFLTPHIIDGPEDLEEVHRVKMLQREEFMKRFYGKSQAERRKELDGLLRYSMNIQGVDKAFRDKPPKRPNDVQIIDGEEVVVPRDGGAVGRGIGRGGSEPPSGGEPPPEGDPGPDGGDGGDGPDSGGGDGGDGAPSGGDGGGDGE